MTHEYAPASDVTLAFFRKDVEHADEQLESIMVSRVVMGEILARIDQAESDRDLAHDDWQDVLDQCRRREIECDALQDQVARLTVALGVERDYLASAEARLERCDGCSEPNRCGCPTSTGAPTDV